MFNCTRIDFNLINRKILENDKVYSWNYWCNLYNGQLIAWLDIYHVNVYDNDLNCQLREKYVRLFSYVFPKIFRFEDENDLIDTKLDTEYSDISLADLLVFTGKSLGTSKISIYNTEVFRNYIANHRPVPYQIQ
jgi:hypothetical protein